LRRGCELESEEAPAACRLRTFFGGVMKSFYRVWLAVSGARYRDVHYTYGTFTDLQQALDWDFWCDLRPPDEPGLVASRALFTYHDIPVETYILGERKQEIDLTSYITIRAGDGTDYSVNQPNWGAIIAKHTPEVPRKTHRRSGELDEAEETFF